MSNFKNRHYPIYIPVDVHVFDSYSPLANKTGNGIKDTLVITNHFIAVDNIFEDEAPFIGLPFDIKITLTIIMAISLFIGSCFKCIMYMYVVRTNKTNRGWMHRPINVLTVTSAIVHHVTHVVSGIWYILVLTMDAPLAEIFGSYVCHIMMLPAVYGLSYLSIGSLGTAIYRVMYIKYEYLVKDTIGEKTLLWLILLLCTTFTGAITTIYMIEDNGDKPGINMCTGLSVTQSQVMIEYEMSNGDQTIVTKYRERVAIFLCIAAQTIEFGIYVWFFYRRYKNDNGNITKYLKQKDIRERNSKNMITFLGQFYGFVVEYSFLISMIILHHLAGENAQHFRAFLTIAKIGLDFALLSSVEVFSSSGLRRFMRHGN